MRFIEVMRITTNDKALFNLDHIDMISRHEEGGCLLTFAGTESASVHVAEDYELFLAIAKAEGRAAE